MSACLPGCVVNLCFPALLAVAHGRSVRGNRLPAVRIGLTAAG